jgi:hypothetical protein
MPRQRDWRVACGIVVLVWTMGDEMTDTSAPERSWLDRTFRLTSNGTTARTEFIAGVTTFLTMVYIVFVSCSPYSSHRSPKWCRVMHRRRLYFSWLA